MEATGGVRPRLPQPYLGRSWLRERLDRPRPVAVVRGPSGFGKTSAVVDWLEYRNVGDEAVAWVRLPPGGDAATGRDVVAAALAERPQARVLVVDELDNLTDERFDRELLDVVRGRPGLRLITCVYSAERFAPHRLLDLDTTVVDATELLLTAEETAALAEALDPTLPDALVRAVHAQSGGWPAVTRASLVAASDSGPVEDVAGLVDRVAAGYVHHHLLASAAGSDRFLPLTALPDVLTAGAVEALAGPGAGARLDGLVTAGLLLRSDTPDGTVYQWPAAARRALGAELARNRPDELPTSHRRLAEHFLAAGRPGAALAHATRGGDPAQVVRTIERSWRSLMVHDREALRQALTSAPGEAIDRSRRAVAMRDVILQLPADRMGSVDPLPRTPAALDELARTPGAAEELDTALAVLVAFRNCAELAQVRDLARRLLVFARAVFTADPPAVAGLYPSVLSQIGVALMAADAHGEAEWPLLEAFRLTPNSPFDYLPRETASKLALLHALSGDTRRAEEWLRRHDAAPAPSSWLRGFIRPVAATARLLVALDRLDLELARRLSGEALAPLRPERADGLFVYARARLALHDGTAADLLDELSGRNDERRGWEERGLSGASMLAAAEADLQLALGRGNQARAILTGPHGAHPALRVGQARLALLSGHPADAVRLATDPAWERIVGHRDRFDMQLIAAVAALRTGGRASAIQSLRRAVDAARGTGTVRPFVLVPRPELAGLADEVPGLAEILATPAVAGHPEIFPAAVPLVSLTVRERLVLEKLAAGLTLQQTADALVVSYHTIRTQQASVYRKLGVETRADAVARAREWGLL